jgi:hypothetical protein
MQHGAGNAAQDKATEKIRSIGDWSSAANCSTQQQTATMPNRQSRRDPNISHLSITASLWCSLKIGQHPITSVGFF